MYVGIYESACSVFIAYIHHHTLPEQFFQHLDNRILPMFIRSETWMMHNHFPHLGMKKLHLFLRRLSVKEQPGSFLSNLADKLIPTGSKMHFTVFLVYIVFDKVYPMETGLKLLRALRNIHLGEDILQRLHRCFRPFGEFNKHFLPNLRQFQSNHVNYFPYSRSLQVSIFCKVESYLAKIFNVRDSVFGKPITDSVPDFSCHVIRVNTTGKKYTSDIKTCFHGTAYVFYSSFGSCCITIIYHDQFSCHTLQQFPLCLGKGCTASCYDIEDSPLGHANNIHLSFTYICEAGFCYGLACLVESEYLTALQKKWSITSIKILNC